MAVGLQGIVQNSLGVFRYQSAEWFAGEGFHFQINAAGWREPVDRFWGSVQDPFNVLVPGEEPLATAGGRTLCCLLARWQKWYYRSHGDLGSEPRPGVVRTPILLSLQFLLGCTSGWFCYVLIDRAQTSDLLLRSWGEELGGGAAPHSFSSLAPNAIKLVSSLCDWRLFWLGLGVGVGLGRVRVRFRYS